MGRTVKVGLDLETASYIANAKGADKATEELGDTLADTAAKGEKLGGITDDADRAGEAIDDLGDSARQAARHVDKLDGEIAEARRELARLSEEWVRADEASRVDLTKGISALESKLRDLKKNRSIQEALIPKIEPAAVAEFVGKFGDSVVSNAKSSTKLGTAGIAIAAAIAVTAAPVLGGSIVGAIVGGVGLGGIVGGVALAVQDPAIKAKGKELGQNFFAGLKDEAGVFVGPVEDAIDALENAAATALPKIGKIFDNTAPGLQAFTDSVIDAGDAILDSFVVASGESAEPLRALGDLVETVGEEVGEMIVELSDNAEDGAKSLDLLADGFALLADGTTVVLEVLSFFGGAMKDQVDIIQAHIWLLEDLIPGLDLTADGFEAGSKAALDYRAEQENLYAAGMDVEMGTKQVTAATSELADKQTAAAKAADGQRAALAELSKELAGELDPVSALLDAQTKLADAQKASAKAIKEHGAKSEEAEKATRDLAKAAIDLQGKAGALGDTFDGRLSAGMRATLRTAGLTERQINDLERQFREAKGAGDQFAKNYKANVSVSGIAAAAKNVRDLRAEINKVRGKTVAINVRVSQRGEILYGNQAPSDMAEGGPVLGPGPKGVDSEIRRLAPGEHVWTAPEVDAAGGHQAMERMRADVLSGGSGAAAARVMPASATQRVIVETRNVLDLSGADRSAFAQLLINTIRVDPAVRAEVKTQLART